MITVLDAGVMTTIQDLGRIGWQKYGSAVGGAMDIRSHRIANLLVGNSECEATLEITITGPTLVFEKASLVALCGGHFTAMLNGKLLPLWQAVYVKADSQLSIKGSAHGIRGYLAVAGGFDVPSIQHSKATYLRAKFGGFKGRALIARDTLPQNALTLANQKIMDACKDCSEKAPRYSCHQLFHWYQPLPEVTLRVIPGEHYSWLTDKAKQIISNKSMIITTLSDRMGFRLKSESLLLKKQQALCSDTVTFGTVQLPASEEVIVLMADRQTSGGYPKVLQVIQVDLPILAQCAPSQKLCFSVVSLNYAEKLLLREEQQIYQLKLGISKQYQ